MEQGEDLDAKWPCPEKRKKKELCEKKKKEKEKKGRKGPSLVSSPASIDCTDVEVTLRMPWQFSPFSAMPRRGCLSLSLCLGQPLRFAFQTSFSIELKRKERNEKVLSFLLMFFFVGLFFGEIWFVLEFDIWTSTRLVCVLSCPDDRFV